MRSDRIENSNYWYDRVINNEEVGSYVFINFFKQSADYSQQLEVVNKLCATDQSAKLVGVLLSGEITDKRLLSLLVNRLNQIGDINHIIELLCAGVVYDAEIMAKLIDIVVSVESISVVVETLCNADLDYAQQYRLLGLIRDEYANAVDAKNIVDNKNVDLSLKQEFLIRCLSFADVPGALNRLYTKPLSDNNDICLVRELRSRHDSKGVRNICEDRVVFSTLAERYCNHILNYARPYSQRDLLDLNTNSGMADFLIRIKRYQDPKLNSNVLAGDVLQSSLTLALGDKGKEVVNMIFDAEGKYSQEQLDASVVKLRNQPSWSEYLNDQEMKTDCRSGEIGG